MRFGLCERGRDHRGRDQRCGDELQRPRRHAIAPSRARPAKRAGDTESGLYDRPPRFTKYAKLGRANARIAGSNRDREGRGKGSGAAMIPISDDNPARMDRLAAKEFYAKALPFGVASVG